ncbi:hypothetical protein DOY81_011391 [Sarcophaga bullata]|nr:hypothetical protein DOY81_011391 [Sarcophaga bullata]
MQCLTLNSSLLRILSKWTGVSRKNVMINGSYLMSLKICMKESENRDKIALIPMPGLQYEDVAENIDVGHIMR